MKITEIPEVAGLEFEEGPHIYRLDGLEIPSVSAVMTPLSNAKYSGINSRTLEKAAGRGTEVHNAIENYIKYDITDIPAQNRGYFEAFLQWRQDANPIPVGSEVRICHRIMRYAGTADLVAYIDGKLTLVDYKTTYTVSDMSCSVQLEAYAQALKNMGVEIEQKMILHLAKDGKYEIHRYQINDAERWRVFGALKTVHDYLAVNGK